MENIDFKIILGDLLDESKNWALGIIKENETEMLELKRELGIDEIDFGSDKAVKFQKLVSDKMESAENFDQYQKFNILYTALWTVATSLKINLNKNNDYETAVRMYWLGRTHGSLDSVVPELMPVSLYENHYHRAKSIRFIKDKRWTPFQEKRQNEIKEIERLADEKFKAGYKHYHSDLASEFKKKPEFKHIPLKEIRKAVGPVAERYGKKKV